MASTTYHTIAIHLNGQLFRKEGKAAGTITPGMLIQRDSNGELVAHASAGAVLQGKKIALESQTPDSDSNASIDIDYVDNERVYYADAQPGERFWMWLADGENAAINAQLVSDGAGALAVATPDATTVTNTIVGTAVTALNNSAGGAPARLLVEIV